MKSSLPGCHLPALLDVTRFLPVDLLPRPAAPPSCVLPRAREIASKVFISEIISDERKLLAVYPVVFFYTFISWMIVLQ